MLEVGVGVRKGVGVEVGVENRVGEGGIVMVSASVGGTMGDGKRIAVNVGLFIFVGVLVLVSVAVTVKECNTGLIHTTINPHNNREWWLR
jgi:hypothetical protein